MMQKTGKREILQILAEEKRMVTVSFYSDCRNEPTILTGSIEHKEIQGKPRYYINDFHIPLRNTNLIKNGKSLELEVRK